MNQSANDFSGRFFSVLEVQAPDEERNIRCNRQQSAHCAVIGLNQYIVNSVVNDRGGKQAEGSDGKKLTSLLNEGYANPDEQGTHTVHKTCAKRADYGIKHTEHRITEKIIRILQNCKSNTRRHRCRKELFSFIGYDERIIENG